jgi:peroxiredoxin
MVALLAAAVLLLSALLLVICWVVYGLLRQNGRILIRLEAAEAALDGRAVEPPSGRVFADRSLSSSKINRAGLAVGTVAPAFKLPTIDGGELALGDYAGRRVLLVFSDPACVPCIELLPRLHAAARLSNLPVIVISRGGADANRRALAECGVTFPVALQANWEISRLYANFATPVAYLIDQHGRIASGVAEGATAILALLSTGDSELRLGLMSGHGPGSQLTH